MTNSAPTTAFADETLVLNALNATPTAQNVRGIDGYLPNGSTVEVKSWSTGNRPSIGSMLDGETREDALKRMLVADIYALVAVDENGKYILVISHNEMLAFALQTAQLTRKASKRGGGMKVRMGRKPSRA